jgi:hypothetical protein
VLVLGRCQNSKSGRENSTCKSRTGQGNGNISQVEAAAGRPSVPGCEGDELAWDDGVEHHALKPASIG